MAGPFESVPNMNRESRGGEYPSNANKFGFKPDYPGYGHSSWGKKKSPKVAVRNSLMSVRKGNR
jgi:hypothetical protein